MTNPPEPNRSVKTAEEERRPWAGFAVSATVILLLGTPVVFGPGSDHREIGILAAIVLVGMIAGLLVARRPQHPVSWLLAATAVSGGLAGLAAELLPDGLEHLEWWQALLAVISGPVWYSLLFMILVMIPLLFPTGSPLSPRWAWVGWLVGATTAVFGVLWALQEEFCTDLVADPCTTTARNPIGVVGLTNPEESTLGGVLYAVLLAGTIAAMASLVVRYRRSGVVQRQQIKWVAFSIGFFVAFTILVDVVWVQMLGAPEPPGYWLIQQFLWLMIPVSIALAILRFRLFEIDRIVSRTVSYGLVAVVLGAVYAGGIIGVQNLLPAAGDLAVVASTLLVAALFTPLRRRIQNWVDRRFNRRRYDAEAVVETFTARLRDEVDLNTITDDLQGVVTLTMEPAAAAVWVRRDMQP